MLVVSDQKQWDAWSLWKTYDELAEYIEKHQDTFTPNSVFYNSTGEVIRYCRERAEYYWQKYLGSDEMQTEKIAKLKKLVTHMDGQCITNLSVEGPERNLIVSFSIGNEGDRLQFVLAPGSEIKFAPAPQKAKIE